jgi:two-component system OmpR family response regulator
MRDWSGVIQTVSHTRETYIDRTRRGLLLTPKPDEQNITWSVLAFPITLHDNHSGVVLTARILDRSPSTYV